VPCAEQVQTPVAVVDVLTSRSTVHLGQEQGSVKETLPTCWAIVQYHVEAAEKSDEFIFYRNIYHYMK